MGGFEAWTRGGLTGISSLRIAPRWVLLAAGGFVLIALVSVAGLRSGQLRGALVFVGFWGLILLFLRAWLIATAQARRFLVTRPDWGDLPRLAALGGFFLVIPALGGVAGGVFLLLLDALDRYAKGS